MKLTKEEKNWILYDVGNSAFTLLIATIMPLYFNYLAEQAGLSSVDYLAYWGYAASVATLFVVFIGPVFGTLADTKGFKKPVFSVALAVGVAACVLMGFAKQWLVFLVIYVIAKTGYSASLIFYDSMLADVTTADRMDQVSSQGYAWGYIGSCVPFVVCLMIVLGAGKLGISMELAMGISFFVTAAWWVLMTVPMLKTYRQKNYVERKPHAFRESFARIGKTFLNVRKKKKIFLFLLAFFFYIDGVYTIIDMATAYGSALGLDSTGLLLALLVTQIVRFHARSCLEDWQGGFAREHLITVCVVAYIGIALFACVLRTQTQFWILAIFVGMFQGGIQALSRSYYAKNYSAGAVGRIFWTA